MAIGLGPARAREQTDLLLTFQPQVWRKLAHTAMRNGALTENFDARLLNAIIRILSVNRTHDNQMECFTGEGRNEQLECRVKHLLTT